MTDDTPTIEQPDDNESAPKPRRLRRSSSDRVLAGVAGGLGSYFDVDPVIFRIGFGLSVFFGGLGIVAYLLLAVFVPTDGEPDWAQRTGRRLSRGGFWRGLGIAVLAIVAVMALFGLAGVGAFAVAVGWGVPTAIAIIAVGLLLVLAAFRGGARWLIPPAIALALGAGTAAAANLDWSDGIGQREYNPVSADAIPADGYKLGVGQLTVDLRGFDWKPKDVVPLDVDLGTGQADVFVPENVCVSGATHVGAGESEVAGERNDGFDVDHSVGSGSTATPRLELNVDVDAGQLSVINSNTASVDTPGYGPGPFHEDTAPLRAAESAACAR
jgi:phage shock protein PspC (stress-responsive transcriptional regulator)